MAKKRNRLLEFFWRHSAGIAFVVMLAFIAVIAYVGYNYVVITRKFDSATRWDIPSRIYSDATPIVPGLTYPRALIEPKLNHVGYHEVDQPVSKPGEYRYVGGNLEIYLQSFDYPDMEFHPTPVRIEMERDTVRRIRRIGDDLSLKAVRIEPELITSIYDDVMEDRVPVDLQDLPEHLPNAIIAVEDRSFRRHEGISIRGIIRAAWTNFRSGGVRAGGSTLTQQLVKNLYLTPERSWRRKMREAVMAIILDARFSKDEILEAYINEIYLGQNGAVQIVGFEQAAQAYFSKRASNLTLPEAATLAGMIRSPNTTSPLRHPEKAKERRDVVLRLMREEKMISDEELAAALEAPMTKNRFPRSINSAPFFVDLVMKQLRENYQETQLRTEGLRIFTTLDTTMQRSAERSLVEGVASLKKSYKHIAASEAPLEGVVVTIEPGTGYVKALVGGTSYRKSQFNRAFQAKRQPGSLFKPFVYLAAMDPARGQDALTAATVLEDSPITIRTGNQEWSPQNYDGRFHGRVSVRRALALSYNIPVVRAADVAGLNNVIRLASTVGVESPLQPYPSISLGSFEVTPLEIAYAYSVLANQGVKAEPITILAVVKADGQVLENREVRMRRVAGASVTHVMNEILEDTMTYGTAARVRSAGLSRGMAGKTGTTNNYRDAWFVGYSPRILTLVWVGFDEPKSTRLAGGAAALPIWIAHMKRIEGMVPDVPFKRPADVITREIDPESGRLATSYCPESRPELFVSGTQPTSPCPLHSWSSEPYFGGIDPPRPGSREDEPGIERETRREREEERKRRRSSLRRIFPWLFE